MSRPLVQLLQPRNDDSEVQEPSEAEFGIDIGLDAVTQRVSSGRTRDNCKKMPVIPSLGSPRIGAAGRSHPSEIRGAATSACAYSTRQSTTFMKNRSAAFSASAMSRWSTYADTTLPLWARYQACALGRRTNESQVSTAGDEVGPAKPPLSATASHPSRRIRSLMARHHGLPGRSANSGCSTPRRICHRMKDIAALRYGRCRGASPNGP